MDKKCQLCGKDHERVDCPFLCNVNSAQSEKIAELRLENSDLQSAMREAIEILEKRPENYRPIFEGPRDKHIPGVTQPTEWQCLVCWEHAPTKEQINHKLNPVGKKPCWEGKAAGLLSRLQKLLVAKSALKEQGPVQNAQTGH